ncbi:unnamed protein product [Clonostachys byssicola]|uniref:Nuclear transport factor 2 n=1 Tax=Clonostachys byssicola TaxID=160290 RepID=A0A9N9YAP4_9HYPO|nr:unnamed protein product [Clonostachys byssicola]
MAAPDIPTLVTQFVENHYLPDYDRNRGIISKYYHPQAMLTFESENHVGSEAIQAKLNSLPFQEIRHDKPNVRVQPSVTDGFVIALITGHFEASGLDKPFGFSQVFQLKVPDTLQADQFLICNDVFLLAF